MIERLRRTVGKTGNRAVVRGIGDDCAVLQAPAGSHLLVTTDLCIEDVHFRREWHPARSVGHRCLARGLSDIAAMGGEPLACFLSLGLPPELSQRWVDGFFQGLLHLGSQFKISLAGGDTSSAGKITADIMVLGTVPAGEALLRCGARPGDRIYVTGKLGGSAAVLQRLYAGKKVAAKKSLRHFYPEPRIEAARWLRKNKLAHAMIDISDGLSVDLAHICRESKVSALINLGAIPVAKGADLALALHGGEDYELLFTAPEKVKPPLQISGVPVVAIGEIQSTTARGPTVRYVDATGRLRTLKPSGWQHFAKT